MLPVVMFRSSGQVFYFQCLMFTHFTHGVITETAFQCVKETLKLPIFIVIDGKVQGLSMRIKQCLPLHENSNWELS